MPFTSCTDEEIGGGGWLVLGPDSRRIQVLEGSRFWWGLRKGPGPEVAQVWKVSGSWSGLGPGSSEI